MEKHKFLDNGLLIVNPEARHPILDLIEYGERQWKEKVDRQSKTLEEGVREYKRRYGRKPPKGFDLWSAFRSAHG